MQTRSAAFALMFAVVLTIELCSGQKHSYVEDIREYGLHSFADLLEYFGPVDYFLDMDYGTFLAPTNSAFDRFFRKYNATGFSDLPRSAVENLLNYHVLPKPISSLPFGPYLPKPLLLTPFGPQGAHITATRKQGPQRSRAAMGEFVFLLTPNSRGPQAEFLLSPEILAGNVGSVTDVELYLISEVLVPLGLDDNPTS